MNTCKYCGFTGELKDFRSPNGKICMKCFKKQSRECCKKYRRNNHKKIREYNKKRHESNRKKHGILPWSQIKNMRLGLYIEQAIAAMFGVPTEQYGNPNVDFICPSGYKIQVKTSSLSKDKYPNWHFFINKNATVDYFIFVAVNNAEDIDKENFKPIHIWMMKGNVLNHKTGTTVSPSTKSKWDKYSIMKEYENKFVACCNIIKKEH